MNNIRVEKMPKFMLNKRCSECDSDVFVVKQQTPFNKYKIGERERIWYCAKCERKLFKEIIGNKEKKWNDGFIQVLRLLRGGQ